MWGRLGSWGVCPPTGDAITCPPAYLLSCPFPARPAFGEVSVSSLHPGGDARFRCATGYQLQGAHRMVCRNATRPFWSAREPLCLGEHRHQGDVAQLAGHGQLLMVPLLQRRAVGWSGTPRWDASSRPASPGTTATT